MNLPFNIALRYLIAKKSTQVIQLITGISILGLTVGTAALVLVLSVFNGFEDLIMGMYVKFNPDIKITPVSGKFFNADASLVYKISKIPGVEAISALTPCLVLYLILTPALKKAFIYPIVPCHLTRSSD